MRMHLFDRPLASNPYEGLPPSATFTVVSQDLSNGLPMPKLHTAEGGNISPHLEWSGFPDQTESFFVSCFDPDAPTPSGFWHWMVIDIPVSVHLLHAEPAVPILNLMEAPSTFEGIMAIIHISAPRRQRATAPTATSFPFTP